MTEKLTINRLDETKPHALFAHYDGQTAPQTAYIALDLRDGRMWADYSAELGNAVPMSVWHGVVRRWPMPPFLTATANRIMDAIAEDAQRVLNGATVGWDGSNTTGRLDDAATDANENIGIEINTWVNDSADEICWKPNRDWFAEDIRQTVSSDVNDAEIERIADEAIAETVMDHPAAVIDRDDVIRWYREYRDEL